MSIFAELQALTKPIKFHEFYLEVTTDICFHMFSDF